MFRVTAVLTRVFPYVVLCLAGGLPSAVRAQDFPSKPLRLIIGQSASSSPDLVARIVALKLGELMRRTVVVDNRPGAGERLAATIAARAAPDGYTLHFGSIASHAIAPAMYRRIEYDPLKDFTPLSLIGKTPNVLATYPGSGLSTLRDVQTQAKARPGKLTYATTQGTSTHLGMELLKARLNIDVLGAHTKDGAVAFNDVMGGRVELGLFNLPAALGHIRAGKLRAIGVTTLARSSQLPDVPTIREAGVPDYEVVVWYALFLPAQAPPAIVQLLHSNLLKVAQDAAFRTTMANTGTEIVMSSPEELARYSAAEIAKWRRVAREAHIELY